MKVWHGEMTAAADIYIFTKDAIYFLEDTKPHEGKAFTYRLEKQKLPIQEVIPEDAIIVPLVSVKRIVANTTQQEVLIEFSYKGKTGDITLMFINDDSFDLAFRHLKVMFLGRFFEYRDQYSVLRSITRPIWLLASASGLTWMLYSLVTKFSVDSSQTSWVAVLNFLGPYGILVIGSLVILTAVYYLFQRIKKPPFLRVLQEDEYHPGNRSLKLGLNYGALLLLTGVGTQGALRLISSI